MYRRRVPAARGAPAERGLRAVTNERERACVDPRMSRGTRATPIRQIDGDGSRRRISDIAHAITLPSKQRLRGKTNLVAAACEGDIFDALGLEWREPWERECVVSPVDPACRIGCAVDSAGAQPDSRGVAPASQ